MANLKEIKTRIATVASTQQTTSAMKLISASKLRKAQLTLLQLRPFSNKLHSIMLATVQDGDTIYRSPFLEIRPKIERVLLMVVTSNSGLCGAFNTSVLKAAMHHIRTVYEVNPDIKEICVMCFGKKATDFFAKQPYKVVANHVEFMNHLNYDEYDVIAEDLLQTYKNHTYDMVDMVSNVFVNAGVYETVVRQKLPYDTEEVVIKDLSTDYNIYMPDKNTVVHNIIPMSFKVRTYMRLAESVTAEFAARMTSMHKATENAMMLQKELKLRYNKARQAAITNEIIEITNGANALSANA